MMVVQGFGLEVVRVNGIRFLHALLSPCNPCSVVGVVAMATMPTSPRWILWR
jgi:hypothetical protein